MIRILFILFFIFSSESSQKGDYDLNLVNKLARDSSRFIAHAGGGISGFKYTNSLEALNYSYSKGFKLFELDIQKTSDNHFVAVHDWKSWKLDTNFQGVMPPTKAEFMELKLHDKFSPLDIQTINMWFTSNKDAVLVTDKTNDPKGFSQVFVDKRRLKMELFTWEAVFEGQQLEIGSSMPNGSLLTKIKGNEIAFLKKHNINEMVLSRKLILKNKKMVENIVQSGINIYAYNINSKGGIGEKSVICFENKYLFGIYADIWDFNQNLECAVLRKNDKGASNKTNVL